MALSCYIFLSYFSCVFSLSLWCIKIYVGVLCVFIYVGVCVCKRARSALKYSANIKNSGGSSHTTAECQQPPSTDRQRERRKSHSQYIKAFINLKNKVLSWMRPYALKTQRTTTETRCFPIHSILALFTRCFSSFPLILFFFFFFFFSFTPMMLLTWCWLQRLCQLHYVLRDFCITIQSMKIPCSEWKSEESRYDFHLLSKLWIPRKSERQLKKHIVRIIIRQSFGATTSEQNIPT